MNYLDGESIEVVDNFNFLGSTIHKDRGIDLELRRRLSLGRTAMNKLTTVMKNHDVSRNTGTKVMLGNTGTKVMLVNSLVFPVLLYIELKVGH